MFRELCGDSTLKNVILVTNMWGEVSEDVGKAREQELNTNFFKSAIDKGAQLARHSYTTGSAHGIIRRIIRNRPTPLKIQRELVDEGKDISDTAAGQAVNKELNEQIRRRQAELKAIQAEMMQALKAKCGEMREELEVETRKLKEQMGRLRDDLAGMASSYQEERRRMEEAMTRMQEQARQERGKSEARYMQLMGELKTSPAPALNPKEERRRMEESTSWMQQDARREREKTEAACGLHLKMDSDSASMASSHRAEHWRLREEKRKAEEEKKRPEDAMRQMQEQARQEKEKSEARYMQLMVESMRSMQEQVRHRREETEAAYRLHLEKMNKNSAIMASNHQAEKRRLKEEKKKVEEEKKKVEEEKKKVEEEKRRLEDAMRRMQEQARQEQAQIAHMKQISDLNNHLRKSDIASTVEEEAISMRQKIASIAEEEAMRQKIEQLQHQWDTRSQECLIM